jgi:hypothetical protein
MPRAARRRTCENNETTQPQRRLVTAVYLLRCGRTFSGACTVDNLSLAQDLASFALRRIVDS